MMIPIENNHICRHKISKAENWKTQLFELCKGRFQLKITHFFMEFSIMVSPPPVYGK